MILTATREAIAMFLVTSPIVINVPTRGLLAVETMHATVQWLANLNIKRNVTSMFVNKKHRYNCSLAFISLVTPQNFTSNILKRPCTCYIKQD